MKYLKNIIFPFTTKKYDFLENKRRHRLIKFIFYILILILTTIIFIFSLSEVTLNNKENIYYFNCKYPWVSHMTTQKTWEMNIWVKMWELWNAIKTKFNLPSNIRDDSIIQQFIQQTNNGEQLLLDYISWKNNELLYITNLKERPEIKCNIVNYWKIIYYTKTFIYTIILIYVFNVILQLLYYKWIIYIIYGNKYNWKIKKK